MTMIYRLLVLLFVLFSCNMSAQVQNPDAGALFDDTEVPRVDIYINKDLLKTILDNPNSDVEYPAVFTFRSSRITDSVGNIGFRLRGNSSRRAEKQSFKVSFNTFVSGRKWQGVEKLNLNSEHNDPSVMRSKLVWNIATQIGAPAARANHVQLYINGNYMGLYINVEHIDENFVQKRYGNSNGNLYKCLYPADLRYRGDNPAEYKKEQWGYRAYQLQTNEQADDYTDLAAFIRVLNQTPQISFVQELEKVFNVNSYLKSLAVEIMTGHWDNYSMNKNNYYLYHNTATQRFEYITYDVDNTFGVDWFNVDWGRRNIYQFYNTNEQRPLASRILNEPIFRQRLTLYIQQLIQNACNVDTLTKNIDRYKNMISPYVERDTYYSKDYGWSYKDFLESFDDKLGKHVTYGLKPFVSTRYYSALSQLEKTNAAPIIEWAKLAYNWAGYEIQIQTYINDEQQPNVWLLYNYNGGVYDSVDITNNRTQMMYRASLQTPTSGGYLLWYIKAIDANGQVSYYPSKGYNENRIYKRTDMPLYINEVMTENKTAIDDQTGSYNDWIELYNSSNTAITTDNIFLTDDIHQPYKWQLPAINIEANSFALVWADNHVNVGNMHANFSLNSWNETLALMWKDNNQWILLDSITVSRLPEDVSLARTTDGAGQWKRCEPSTPLKSNTATAITNISDKIALYLDINHTRLQFEAPANCTQLLVQINDTLGRSIWVDNSKTPFSEHQQRNINITATAAYAINIVYYDSKNNIISTQTQLTTLQP